MYEVCDWCVDLWSSEGKSYDVSKLIDVLVMLCCHAVYCFLDVNNDDTVKGISFQIEIWSRISLALMFVFILSKDSQCG